MSSATTQGGLDVESSPADRPEHTSTTSANPFVCSICQKTYSRLDHLGRHYRSHTNQKPFTCGECGKSFARVDLLRRHKSVHLDRDDSTKKPRLVRQRASKACTTCAAAKLKCSETRPCPRCAQRGIPCQNDYNLQFDHGVNESTTLLIDSPDVAVDRRTSNVGGGDEAPRIHFLSPESTNASPARRDFGSQLPTNPFTRTNGQDSTSFANSQLPDLPMQGFGAFDDSVIGGFLREIVVSSNTNGLLTSHQTGILPGVPDFGQRSALPDVLDFGFDDFVDVPPSFFDYGSPPMHPIDANAPSRARSEAATPTVRKAIDIGQQAFKDSFWLWTPAPGDNRAAEQIFQALSPDDIIDEEAGLTTSTSFRISSTSRDRMLAMVLTTSDPVVQRQVVSRFPSAELITSMLQRFASQHVGQISPWIHLPSISPDQEIEMFIAGLLAAAAVTSKHQDVRKLGLAISEAVRIAVAVSFEEDNRRTRDLRTLQSFALNLHSGFWSGGRRKMEIAESFTYPLITMLRRSGHFRRQGVSASLLEASNNVSSVEDVRKTWVQAESFKRLVYHIFMQDTAISMSLLTQPLISHSELLLDLPCHPALWNAVTVEDWKEAVDELRSQPSSVIPTARDLIGDLEMLKTHAARIDVQMSIDILISSIWSRVWQFCQMQVTTPIGGAESSLAAKAYQQELIFACRHIQLRSMEWMGGMSPSLRLKLELCSMHLHVSLERIQLLAGKEGESEARKTVSVLRTWAQTQESRQALSHAGQVLRAALGYQVGTLRGFPAVAVYHASLTMWAYGVLGEESYQHQQNTALAPAVQLDGEETVDLQRFLMLGQGRPYISNYGAKRQTALESNGQVFLSDPLSTMTAIIALLKGMNGDEQDCPPMVANLSKLMLSLGKAAVVMKRATA